jgi:hypothetical protein
MKTLKKIVKLISNPHKYLKMDKKLREFDRVTIISTDSFSTESMNSLIGKTGVVAGTVANNDLAFVKIDDTDDREWLFEVSSLKRIEK